MNVVNVVDVTRALKKLGLEPVRDVQSWSTDFFPLTLPVHIINLSLNVFQYAMSALA